MADKFPDPKVGDPVAYYGAAARNGCPSAKLAIERVTATQIVVSGQKFKRTDGLEIKRDRYGSGPRKWSALELERLHALVLTFEDGAAALKATLEPDFVPETKS